MPNTKTRLIFLDFDGCMHHFFPIAGEDDEKNEHFYYRPAFEGVLRQSPYPVEIVISSAWRRDRNLETLRGLFSPDIAPMIIGATPWLSNGLREGSRLVEIETWLEQNGRTQDPWIAVDDCPELFAPGTNVALVTCHDRFASREAALLTAALQDPVLFAAQNPCLTRMPRTP